MAYKIKQMLRETYINLIKQYSQDNDKAVTFWDEIESHYSSPKRHYHTLEHLDSLLNQLIEIKNLILNWNTILFTIYYHDIIYNSLKSNNEEKSAELAEIRMKQIGVPSEEIELCKSQIIASKTHLFSTDSDTNYFTDADLSILGKDWETYEPYLRNVRKEYSIYPWIIYKPGRKKVLKHFLDMDRIYKTKYFYDKFESKARSNLRKELEFL